MRTHHYYFDILENDNLIDSKVMDILNRNIQQHYLIKRALFILLVLFILSLTINSSSAENYTYLDLTADISNETVSLNNDYQFNNDSDSNLINGIQISKNITINGNNHYIDGNNQARGLYIHSNCNIILENLTIKNCFSAKNGGAIFLSQNSNLTLKNCKFINNKVYNANGGAISSQSSTNVNIHSSLFLNNSAVRVSDLEWIKFKSGMGSALCAAIGSNINVYDSNFTQNNAYLSTVLIISYDDKNYKMSNLFMDNCLFQANTARTNSAIYLDEMGSGEIHNSIFKSNVATDYGGTLILDAPIHALVKDCLFEDNSVNNGGGIYVTEFKGHAALDVLITGCNFTDNRARQQGGAICSNDGNVNVVGCNFYGNHATAGGAISSKAGYLNIAGSYFKANHANYGGGMYLFSQNNIVKSCVFCKNTASVRGGGIYSRSLNVDSDNCNYISNSAVNGADVFGAFEFRTTQSSYYYGETGPSVKLSSVWKTPLSENIRVMLKGPRNYNSGWIKTDSNGYALLKIYPAVGTYSLSILMSDGVCYSNQIVKIIRAPCKLKAPKITTTYASGKLLKIHVKNKKTNKGVAYVKLTLKISHGKSYNLLSDDKGIVRFDTSKLKVGKHKIIISSRDKNVRLSKVKSQITIKKASVKLTAPKSVKKNSKLKITVKNKASFKPLKKTAFKIKLYSKNGHKTLKAKTDSGGILKIPTKKLSRGSYRVNVILKNRNYNLNTNLRVKIK